MACALFQSRVNTSKLIRAIFPAVCVRNVSNSKSDLQGHIMSST